MDRPGPSAARSQLVAIIGDSVYQALGLKQSLEDEHAALAQQDMDALSSAIDAKGAAVGRLQGLEQARQNLCASTGFPAGAEQMQQVAAWCDEDAVIENGWQHLLDIAADCAALNVTNGAIIHSRRQQIETSLAVIRSGNTDTGTYGRSGGRPAAGGQRSLAEA